MSYVCTPISINCFTRSRPGYPPLLLFEWQMNTHHHHAPADAVAVLSTLTLCLPCAQASACAPRIAAKHERHSTRPRTHTQITPRRPVQHQSSMRSSHVVTWTSRTGAYLPCHHAEGRAPPAPRSDSLVASGAARLREQAGHMNGGVFLQRMGCVQRDV